MSANHKSFYNRLVKRYRLIVNDNANYTEVYSTSISKLKLSLTVFAVFSLGAMLVTALFFYSPLKKLLPGYPPDELRELMIYNSIMVDSLSLEIEKRDNYLMKIQKIIEGEIIEEGASVAEHVDSEVEMEPMANDSIFDDLIGPDQYKFSHLNTTQRFNEITRINFFTPVSGLVTNKFNATPGHFGTDVVGDENSPISCVLDGTVVFAEWSVSTGYVVQIQHDYNIVSIYKHNSDVLVKQGDKIKAGDLIAIMGNEGELSTGPHLHFELWQNGIALDPEQYITF